MEAIMAIAACEYADFDDAEAALGAAMAGYGLVLK